MLTMSVSNRIDGTPILSMSADDAKSRKTINRLYAELEAAQMKAIPKKKADIHNVCGSMGDERGVYSMTLALLLGGAEVKERT